MGKGSEEDSSGLPADQIRHRRGSFGGNPDDSPTPDMQQTYAHEVTAVVWTGGNFLGALKHPGHAALTLRRNRQIQADFDDLVNNRYVSYIPADDANANNVRPATFQPSYREDMLYETSNRTNERLGARVIQPRLNQQLLGAWDSDDAGPFMKLGEQAYEGRYGTKADTFVDMPALNDGQLGIDCNRIVTWCVNFKNSHGFYYKMVDNKRNCASVAWGALRSGGGDAYCSLHTSVPKHRMYITPKEFADYSQYVKLGIQKASLAYDFIHTEYQTKLGRNPELVAQAPIGFRRNEIYTLRDWKNESAVSWKLRGFILRRIDSAIEKYHSYNNWDGNNYSDKLEQLLTIIINLQEHLQKSQSGRRDAAIVALARQVIRVVSNLQYDAIDPWDTTSYYNEHANPALLRSVKKE